MPNLTIQLLYKSSLLEHMHLYYRNYYQVY